MHSNHLSATETVYKFKLSVTAILKWKRIYYEKGTESLEIDRRGRPKNMNFKENKNEKN
ncbi:MAG: helix-turn-helix domain-containing protein [Clostridiales bacterium]|nr:helix-turn-helix domain-containing protein [Clostridiales bacterium]